MLIRIKVENFKSFEGITELTTVPSKRVRPRGLADHCIKVKKNRFLRYVAIYGANAAGKTNIVDFFKFFQRTLRFGLPQDSNRYFCRNRDGLDKKESSFEIQFSVNGDFYAYGFSALLSERRITSEWLVKLEANGNSNPIYELVSSPVRQIHEYLKLEGNDSTRFRTYASDFANVQDSLFLTELNRNKSFTQDSPLRVFNVTFNWIMSNIRVFSPSDSLMDLRFYFDSNNTNLVNNILPTFDAGATNISLEEASFTELTNNIPAPAWKNFVQNIRNEMELSKSKTMNCSVKSGLALFNFEIWSDREEPQNITTLSLKHGTSSGFRFEDESDGTRRLFDLFSILLTNSDNVVFIFDELDRSLHPMLTRQFIKLFDDRYKNSATQLFFTTHEASLMDPVLFRRDEIWFVNRNSDNCSSVYSLERFNDSDTRSIEKSYLEGRYGAVPVLKNYKFNVEN